MAAVDEELELLLAETLAGLVMGREEQEIMDGTRRGACLAGDRRGGRGTTMRTSRRKEGKIEERTHDTRQCSF